MNLQNQNTGICIICSHLQLDSRVSKRRLDSISKQFRCLRCRSSWDNIYSLERYVIHVYRKAIRSKNNNYPEMSYQEFVSTSGHICPLCRNNNHSKNKHGWSFIFESEKNDEYLAEESCKNCGSEWSRVYSFTNRKNINNRSVKSGILKIILSSKPTIKYADGYTHKKLFPNPLFVTVKDVDDAVAVLKSVNLLTLFLCRKKKSLYVNAKNIQRQLIEYEKQLDSFFSSYIIYFWGWAASEMAMVAAYANLLNDYFPKINKSEVGVLLVKRYFKSTISGCPLPLEWQQIIFEDFVNEFGNRVMFCTQEHDNVCYQREYYDDLIKRCAKLYTSRYNKLINL